MAVAFPKVDRNHRNRRHRKVGSSIIAAQKLTTKLLEQERGDLTDLDMQLLEDNRPRVRADCVDNGIRPCPFVSCRHHTWCDVNPQTGAIVLNFPDLEPWELEHSCSLDLAEEREETGYTLEECGVLLNLTRERVRQIEGDGLGQLKARAPMLPRSTGDGGEEKGVRPMANLRIMKSANGARAIVVRTPEKPPGCPNIIYTCGACGKRETTWLDGFEADWLAMLAALTCMLPSGCCGAPVTAKIEGLPKRVRKHRDVTLKRIRTDIIEALRRAGTRGMSWRQIQRRVRGSVLTVRLTLRELTLGSGAQVVLRATESYPRYFLDESATSETSSAEEES